LRPSPREARPGARLITRLLVGALLVPVAVGCSRDDSNHGTSAPTPPANVSVSPTANATPLSPCTGLQVTLTGAGASTIIRTGAHLSVPLGTKLELHAEGPCATDAAGQALRETILRQLSLRTWRAARAGSTDFQVVRGACAGLPRANGPPCAGGIVAVGVISVTVTAS
jgi:hypothetical protein